MGLATAKLVLAVKPDSNGLHDVRIRFIRDRVVRYTNLGIAIQKKHWNEKATEIRNNWILTGDTQHVQHNLDLTAELARARTLIRSHPTATAEELKQLFRPTTAAAAPAPAEP